MYKRIFPLLLTLALLLCAAPALAADAAINSAVFYSNGETIIRRESSYELGNVWTCSQDGVAWTEIPGWEKTALGPFVSDIECMGRGFFAKVVSPVSGCLFSLDGMHWTEVGEKDWLMDSDEAWQANPVLSQKEMHFIWTGQGYIMYQNVRNIGKAAPDIISPRNTKITYLDENLNMTGEHDFGAQVLEAGYSGAAVYARVAEADGTKIYRAGVSDGKWEDSGFEEFPQQLPAKIIARSAGDELAGDYVFRKEGDRLLCSNNGVSFGALDTVAEHMSQGSCASIRAYACRDGVIVQFLPDYGGSPDYALYPRAALDTACAKSGDTYQMDYAVYTGDGSVIVRREAGKWSSGGTVYTLSWSDDGVNWRYADTPGYDAQYAQDILNTGRGFFSVGPWPEFCQFSLDGVSWYSVGGKEWLTKNRGYWRPGPRASVEIQLLWTGSGYLARQSITAPHGQGEIPQENPDKSVVWLLDGQLDIISEYDFGSPVLEVRCSGGTCYARVDTPQTDGGQSTDAIYSSPDGQTWERTGLTDLPRTLPDSIRALGEGDVLAAPYVFRRENGSLYVSDDGVYFARLAQAPETEGELTAACGAGGAVVIGSYWAPVQSYSSEAITAALAARYPGARIYATLDGAYISFDDPPYAKNQRVMVPLRNISEAVGFTVEWIREDGRDLAVCTREGVTVRVEIGSARAEVNGEVCVLEAPSEVLRGRTYVPIRFFSEQFGLDVDWDQDACTVLLKQ